jgi:hypothetical protein
MNDSPCDTLPGRLRDICTGAAGLSELKRRAYITRWIADGRLSADPGNAAEVPPVHGILPGEQQIRKAETPQGGPGTELKAMLASIGIEPGARCPCRDMMRKMDVWGVTGCREHRGEIVLHVQEQMANRSWREKLAAASHAITGGLAFRLNPVDIPGSLVDEAIRRAAVA